MELKNKNVLLLALAGIGLAIAHKFVRRCQYCLERSWSPDDVFAEFVGYPIKVVAILYDDGADAKND